MKLFAPLWYTLLAACTVAASSDQAAPRPNILFILVDDLGYAEVGFNRDVPDVEVKTPNVDSLVADGIRLTRHYVHRFCTPSRTSLQSGRLPVHINTGLGSPCSDNTGIPQNMTGLAEKLKQAGYKTAMAGKWDAGMATPAHTPHGRGYDTSLNYFSHKNDFWSQANMQTCCESDQTIIDFWHTDRGASHLNSTGYSEFLYQKELVSAIQNHNGSEPLMIFYAPHVAHCPLQVPKFYYDEFGFMTDDEGHCKSQTVKGVHSIDPAHPDLEYKCRQQYHAMVHIMDEVVGNLTAAIKAKPGMWDNTLVIFSSDNGGPVDLAENAANNWPLRGGKYSVFEGGIRVAAFVSGGFVPAKMRGTVNNEMIHIADWYGTLSTLAGVDPADQRAKASGLPPIDSVDVWPLLSGETGKSPRSGFPVDHNCVVQGDWKLITSQTSPDFWQGPKFPNSTSLLSATRHIDWAYEDPQRVEAPPQPFLRLVPCDAGTNKTLAARQRWSVLSSTPQEICTQAPGFSHSPCWNVQRSAPTGNIILWGKQHASNEMFALRGQGAASTLYSATQESSGCIGGRAGGQLKAMPSCANGTGVINRGWTYDTQSQQLRVPATQGGEATQGGAGMLCVTAEPKPNNPPQPANHHNCHDGCLFNVVADPTEQTNLYSAQPAMVANLTSALNAYTKGFFQNKDKFKNNCPAGTKNCACWMAKNRYDGFMGPFAMLDMPPRRPL